jgi:hypothetical protein
VHNSGYITHDKLIEGFIRLPKFWDDVNSASLATSTRLSRHAGSPTFPRRLDDPLPNGRAHFPFGLGLSRRCLALFEFRPTLPLSPTRVRPAALMPRLGFPSLLHRNVRCQAPGESPQSVPPGLSSVGVDRIEVQRSNVLIKIRGLLSEGSGKPPLASPGKLPEFEFTILAQSSTRSALRPLFAPVRDRVQDLLEARLVPYAR